MSSTLSLPVIDISALVANTPDKQRVAQSIGNACREYGFFYITGHGVDQTLQIRLESLSRQFFDQPFEEKVKCQVLSEVHVLRGYHPFRRDSMDNIDVNEKIRFFGKLTENDPKLDDNLYPDIARYRETMIEYIRSLKQLARQLMAGIALSLGVDENFFHKAYTREAEVSLDSIYYLSTAAVAVDEDRCLGIGEHTDYGLLTILKQDNCGGLQVRTISGWMDVTPIEGTFVCNIGDMLERATAGLYRSAAHRVKRPSGQSRLSFPFFLGPNFDCVVKPIEQIVARNGGRDNQNERHFESNCTFGEYLLSKLINDDVN